ncbi:hypothetical protein [Klenkia brasiliensis]|uniref:Uncharacterized protein n=1 Tax=Klenkia brasiliensis TaxID=333142 RepID=A0A1G7YE20_9ACTN|nr:hypothetical protein [Klenkia brasiliensis]SDG94792.1 hypothetical protein SAMN05660324_3927 [Klenkia brasiliensis]
MGRRDAVQFTLELVAECRRLLPGLVVTWEPGWEKRGNGTTANYSFGTMHHTASPSSLARPFPTQTVLRDGRPGLDGPLCNTAGPACTVEVPRLHVNAAHPANHAGASRASGPVPALKLFNPQTWGHEIDYAGSAPMLAGQLLVALALTRALGNLLGRGSVEIVRAHQETSVTGKWDPGYAPGRTVDMAAFRRQAAAITPVEEFLMALSDAEQRELLQFVRDFRTPHDYRTHHGSPTDDFVGQVMSVRKEVVKLTGSVQDDHPDGATYALIKTAAERTAATVDPGKVVVQIDYAKLAEAIEDVRDRRARDGNPATGPVS